MKTLVKICGMTDARAVEAAIDAGADAIGFVFYAKSPRNVSAEFAQQISASIPSHILRVAVTLHPEASLWQNIEAVFQPDVLQTDQEDFARLDVAEGIARWPVLREGANVHVPENSEYIYEGVRSGHGEKVDWQRAAEIAARGRMILAGGLDAGNVADAIAQVRPYGVDVSSAVESAPGKKDIHKIAAFIAAAKAASKPNEVQNRKQS